MKIKKAIITAAGSGTRFLPATKSMPKEMLPIVDIPIVQLVVEELVVRILKHITHSPNHLEDGGCPRIQRIDNDIALCGFKETIQTLRERCLPRTILSDEGDQLAKSNL